MENYTLGEQKTIESPCPLQTDKEALIMKVTGGSKFRNLMPIATKRLKDPKIRQVLWNAQGPGISKAISCAEMIKKRIEGLHQLSAVRFVRIEQYWEPKMEGLDRLKVNKDMPAISILLSKDPLDSSDPSYQAPGSREPFCTTPPQNPSRSAHGHNHRKNKKSQPRGDDPKAQPGPPSTDRKRKRWRGKGRGGESGGSEGPPQNKGDTQKDQKGSKSQNQSEPHRPRPHQSGSPGGSEKMDAPAQSKKQSLADKLDILTKVT